MPKNVTILRTDFAPGSRVIAISDIHGHAGRLHRLLPAAAYRPGEDYLIIVGDSIEKGPDSLATLREIMRLAAESNRVYVLMGNVDLWRVSDILDPSPEGNAANYRSIARLDRGWGSSLFTEMCREIGISYTSLDDFPAARAAVTEAFAAELDFLDSRPTILLTPRYLFVHGGLPCHEDELEILTEKNACTCLKYDRFIDDLDVRGVPRFTRTVLVGHWPVSLYRREICSVEPYYSEAHNVISLDGGCGLKRESQLNALLLDVDTGSTDWVAVDDLPTVRALDAQAASANPFSIGWGDNEVRLTGSSAPSAYVEIEHLRTGRRMYVPEDDLYEEDGVQYCCDITNYALPVEVGDELRLVRVMPDAVLAKKGAVVGWYRGRYA